MTAQLGSLTTPEEYINYYYDELKVKLQSTNIQISKVGFAGFLLNTLGFTQFDIKTYFDTLFREAFLASSSKSENLNLHASIYNYNIQSSTPANITGNLIVDLSLLPMPSSDYTETIIQNLKININNIIYTLEAIYTISGSICKIQKITGEIYYIPFKDNTLPIMEFYQYDTESFNFILPYYTYGTYYQKIIDLENKTSSAYEIIILIKTKNDIEYENYKISTLKHLSNSTEKTVFIEKKESKIIIEFGSGIYGLYIPEADIKISIKLTEGKTGNISQNIAIPYDGMLTIINSNNVAYNAKPSDIIKVNVSYATGGTNILVNEDLRLDIINYIQTRNNLISETDYYNIIKKYTSDFVLIFKKAHIIDNCIYCFILLRDLNQVPLLTKSISVTHNIFNINNLAVIYKPTFNDQKYISPFVYIFDDVLLEYKGYIYFEEYDIYFSEIIKMDEKTTIINPPPLTLKFKYNSSNLCTNVFAYSYQDISQFQLYISIPKYNIFNKCMLLYDDYSHTYNWITDYNGIVIDCVDIEINMHYNDINNPIYTYKQKNTCLCYDISQLLTLKIFDIVNYSYETTGPRSIINNNNIIMHIPVMLLNIYESDQTTYNNKLLSVLSNMSVDQNRMISDTLQFRFLNTEIIISKFLKVLTLQQYDFDITLPFKLTVNIVGNKQYLTNNLLDSTIEIDNLRLDIAEVLFSNYSGTQISFYQSKIIDIIHSVLWVKSCSIEVTDSNLVPKVITNSNFELLDQTKIINSNLIKLDSVEFCPVYVYWDLENIIINVRFE
jgi:hypothetical protein